MFHRWPPQCPARGSGKHHIFQWGFIFIQRLRWMVLADVLDGDTTSVRFDLPCAKHKQQHPIFLRWSSYRPQRTPTPQSRLARGKNFEIDPTTRRIDAMGRTRRPLSP